MRIACDLPKAAWILAPHFPLYSRHNAAGFTAKIAPFFLGNLDSFNIASI
jgi:hypothetical protein